MRPDGWIFMIVSIGVVVSLAGYCYYKVMTTPSVSNDDTPADG